MHEYHIVEGVVKQILEKAKNSNAKKITSVTLILGELSGLQEESIRIYFENLSKDNIRTRKIKFQLPKMSWPWRPDKFRKRILHR